MNVVSYVNPKRDDVRLRAATGSMSGATAVRENPAVIAARLPWPSWHREPGRSADDPRQIQFGLKILF